MPGREPLFRPRCSALLIVVFFVVVVNPASAQSATGFPKVEGESLTGHQVILPDAAFGKVAILIFGFTKASKTSTSAWAQKLSADFSNEPSFTLYQLPVIESAPRFIRGMIVSSMRKGVPARMRDHFVPIVQGEATLKSFVSYKAPDDAYLVVLDGEGRVAQQGSGPLNQPTYSEIRQRIESLLKVRAGESLKP